jgi:hypothetical protein
VNDGAAHARADVDTLNAHHSLLSEWKVAALKVSAGKSAPGNGAQLRIWWVFW